MAKIVPNLHGKTHHWSGPRMSRMWAICQMIQYRTENTSSGSAACLDWMAGHIVASVNEEFEIA
jgi:hypothetical protein